MSSYIPLIDMLIAAECLGFGATLLCMNGFRNNTAVLFSLVFVSLALFAGFATGLQHGLLAEAYQVELRNRALISALGSAGVAALCGWAAAGMYFLPKGIWRKLFFALVYAGFIAYLAMIFLFNQQFELAVLNMLAPAFVLLVVFLVRYGKKRDQASFYMLTGMMAVFIAVWGLKSPYADRSSQEALYHIALAVAALLAFAGGRILAAEERAETQAEAVS